MPGGAPFSVVVPVCNEAKIFRRSATQLLETLRGLGSAFDLVVCENGSTDETPAIAEELRRGNPEVRVERLPTPNYGLALRHAISACRHDVVVLVNIDFWSFDFLREALARLEHCDLVIGSKAMRGARDERPLLRRVITRAFNWALRVAFGFKGTDTHGLKAFRRPSVSRIISQCVTDQSIFDTELVLRAEREGLRITEIPVAVRELRQPSYWSVLRRSPEVTENLLRLWWEFRLAAESWRVFRLSLQILAQMLREQGPRAAIGFAWLGLRRSLQGRALPHTPEVNRVVWTSYDWSLGGHEWSRTPEWTLSVVEHIVIPNIPEGSRVLEIGPGAGRWTEFLVPRASRVVLVDLTPACLDLCRARFQHAAHVEYLLNDGSDLSAIPANTIDRIWSWDVFVHVRSEEVERYLQHFARILSPGGRGVIHHSNGARGAGWRSVVPAEEMARLCRAQGLTVVRQFNTWGDGRWMTPLPTDVITVFEKP